MTGHLLAMTWMFDMLPPPPAPIEGDVVEEVVVDSERRVAVDVFFRYGHMCRDWERRDSIVGLFAMVNIVTEGIDVGVVV